MEITLTHSAYWLLLIVPAGAAIGWWIYGHRRAYEDWSSSLRWLLAALRAFTVIALGWLLLEPFFIRNEVEEEKPFLLLFQDVSHSVSQHEQRAFLDLSDEEQRRLEEKYEVVHRSFAEFVREEEADPASTDDDKAGPHFTNYEAIYDYVNEGFYGANVGAIAVATDGIQTLGADPRYLRFTSNPTLFALALGDTTQQPDVALLEVLNNPLVFLKNEFEVKARLRCVKIKGSSVTARLMHDGVVVAEEQITATSNLQTIEIQFKPVANKPGLQRYSVILVTDATESNVDNNQRETFIEVLDNRTRIVLLAKAPHPDIAAIRLALEANEQYEVHATLIDDWDGKTEHVDLFILHGLPADAQDLNKINVIRKEKIPVWSVVTPHVSTVHFNAMELGLNIRANRQSTDEVTPTVHDAFNLFRMPETPVLKRYPPLRTIFGEYVVQGSTQIALFQAMGNLRTERPLLMFSADNDWKRAVLCGEGWWRWRLSERMRGDRWTDDFVSKTVQYLAIRQKHARLNVHAPTQLWEGHEVVFQAEYYNASFELSNAPEVNLTIEDSSGFERPFSFQRDRNAYRLSIGTLSPGTYQWTAQVQDEAQRFSQTGEFIVKRNDAERVTTVADGTLLHQWSDGRVYTLAERSALIEDLLNLPGAQTILRTDKTWQRVIEWKWLLIILTSWLTLEWVLRKLNGHY